MYNNNLIKISVIAWIPPPFHLRKRREQYIGVYRLLVEKPEDKRPLGRRRRI
jgi:hypothetical protein